MNLDALTPYWVKMAYSDTSREIIVPKKELDDRYIKFAIIPSSLFLKTRDSFGNLTLSAKKIVAMEKKLIAAIEKEKALSACVERNNRGMSLEKEGKVEDAISIYEENIKPKCYPATHSFNRLLVLYRKSKDYKNEKRVCKRAVSVFKGSTKYIERLEKIEALIQKK